MAYEEEPSIFARHIAQSRRFVQGPSDYYTGTVLNSVDAKLIFAIETKAIQIFLLLGVQASLLTFAQHPKFYIYHPIEYIIFATKYALAI